MDRLYRVERRRSTPTSTRCYVIERSNCWYELKGDIFTGYEVGSQLDAEEVSVAEVLPPVMPSKIVAVGLNYRDHAKEMNKTLPDEPLIFLKPSTAVVGPLDEIILPVGAGRVDHEAELGIVIGKTAHNVSADCAQDYVLGLTCVNDVTDRDLQRRDVQYTRGKGFDTFAPIGPAIAVDLDGSALNIESAVNGDLRQSSNTRELIFPLEQLVEFVTGVMTLLPGDIISTGTPSGVGPLRAGDRVAVKVEGVGELINDVVSDERSGR